MKEKMVTRWIGLDTSPRDKKIYLMGTHMFPYFFMTRELARKSRLYSRIEPVKVRIPQTLADRMTAY